jgi:hypothetical protein
MRKGGRMDICGFYLQEGYKKGFEDAKRTGGKITQEDIDRYLNAETRRLLSTAHLRDFIEGWYKGFNNGAAELTSKLVKKNGFERNNLYEVD